MIYDVTRPTKCGAVVKFAKDGYVVMRRGRRYRFTVPWEAAAAMTLDMYVEYFRGRNMRDPTPGKIRLQLNKLRSKWPQREFGKRRKWAQSKCLKLGKLLKSTLTKLDSD